MDAKAKEPEWSLHDKKLVLGWQTLQDETCKRCGVPVWLGHSENSDIDFSIKLSTCYSCQALENRENKNDPKGATPVANPVPAEVEGMTISLPSRQEAFETVQ